jgi:hypothetical protein
MPESAIPSKRDRKRLRKLKRGRKVPMRWIHTAFDRGWLASELVRFPGGCATRWYFTAAGLKAAGLDTREEPR